MAVYEADRKVRGEGGRKKNGLNHGVVFFFLLSFNLRPKLRQGKRKNEGFDMSGTKKEREM